MHPRPWSFCINYAEHFVKSPGREVYGHVLARSGGGQDKLRLGTVLRYLNRKTHKTLTDAILTCIWYLYLAVSPCTCHRQAFKQFPHNLYMNFVNHNLRDTDMGRSEMGQVIMNSDYFGSTKIASCDKDFDASISIRYQRSCNIDIPRLKLSILLRST